MLGGRLVLFLVLASFFFTVGNSTPCSLVGSSTEVISVSSCGYTVRTTDYYDCPEQPPEQPSPPPSSGGGNGITSPGKGGGGVTILSSGYDGLNSKVFSTLFDSHYDLPGLPVDYPNTPVDFDYDDVSVSTDTFRCPPGQRVFISSSGTPYCASGPCGSILGNPSYCNGLGSCVNDYVRDADGDGYYTDSDSNRFEFREDCDDNNYNVHPGAAEVCDGLDNDCDGVVDGFSKSCVINGLIGDSYCYNGAWSSCVPFDADSDGFNRSVDCDDSNPSVYPGAVEVCDGVPDNNCDGVSDEGRVCCESEQSFVNGSDFVYYSWNGTDCVENVLRSYCEDSPVVNGYLVNQVRYVSESSTVTTACSVECSGPSSVSVDSFFERNTVTYAPGCVNGECVETVLSESCGDGNELTEYYCDGFELVKVVKDCDDFDNATHDFSCVSGVCTANQRGLVSGLNYGQVNVSLFNNGTVPFIGVLNLSVNSFCPGRPPYSIVDQISIPVNSSFSKLYDFATVCESLRDDFVCENALFYGSSCEFGFGSGCGLFSREVSVFQGCETCCGDTVYTSDVGQCNSKSCDGSVVSLVVVDGEGEVFVNETTPASWCCK